MKVSELIALIEKDGWVQVRMKGSHRQFHHPTKPGTVTVAGKPSVDIPPDVEQRAEAGWTQEMSQTMQYLVIVEKGPNSFGAYVPDLPGCIATAESREEVLQLIREAIEFHIEGLREDGHTIPQPSSVSAVVDVKAA